MMTQPFIVGFGGSTRPGSSGERLVTASLVECERLGARTELFSGPFLCGLPHYAPENTERNASQRAFVEAIRNCDGIVISTPSYHGGISGLVKNALDLLEDLRDDERVYFDGRAAGLIVSAAGWQGGGVTLSSLRDMVHAMRGWPTPIGVMANSAESPLFDENGNIASGKLKAQILAQAQQVMQFARNSHAARHSLSIEAVS